MKTKLKRSWVVLLGIMLALAVVLVPGLSSPAYAAGAYSDYVSKPEWTVWFNGIEWNIIEDNSSAQNAGTVTLLSNTFLDKDLPDGATIEFDKQGNTSYNDSTLKQWLDSYYAENFKGVDSTVRITQVDGQDTRLYLLSVDEAQRLSDGVLAGKHDPGVFSDWWLRTAGTTEGTAAYVLAGDNSGSVMPAGIDVKLRNHVRAALKLNLSRVSFDNIKNEFTPLVCYTDYENGVRTEKFCSNCKVFDASSTNVIGSNSANGEWIAIEGTVDYPYRIRVSGNASIILKDGATLNATKGIEVSAGNSLTIYSQTDARMGRLNATATQGTGNVEEGNAGIGGSNLNSTNNCGTITINGGIIFAQGGDSSAHAESGAGIGGGYDGNGGTVTINGGKVTAVGGDDSAGIGGGFQGSTHGTVTLGSDVAVKAGADESSATVVTDSFANNHSQKWVHTEGVFEQEPNLSKTVTFKVVNGSWDDGTTADKKVTLAGYEGDLLYLAQDQIPKVGKRPNEYYKAGVWDTTPSANTVIAEDTVYTYTYAKDSNFPVTVTFKVVNGAWNTGNSGDMTVTLLPQVDGTHHLENWQIPFVGNKPADRSFKRGSWDVEPKESRIEEDTVYTYTYAKRDLVTSKVTFKVVGGTWNDGTSDAREVTLSDYEGYPVRLNNEQIPEVGANPDSTHKKDGYWNMWPLDYVNTMGDQELVYTYRERQPISHTVTFKVENGSWDDGTTEDKTVTLTGLEGDTLKLAGDQIPKADTKPATGYIRGRWVTPGPSSNTAITADTTYTYSYWDKSAAVPYLDWDADQNKLVEKTGDEACANYEIVDGGTKEFKNNTWYVAKESMALAGTRIAVTGVAHLIIEDGVTLELTTGGIKVEEGSTLYIHSQSEGSDAGSLVAKAWWQTNNAGIGSDGTGTAGGTIVIDGANVTAEGAAGGAGIGGGRGGSGGTITINGGTVVTQADDGGAGIGGGENGAGGIITINGGTITNRVDTKYTITGIGGGQGGAGGTITINAGTIDVYTSYGAGIGGGPGGAGGTIVINGGTITAESFGDAAGIGGGQDAAGGNITITGGNISAKSLRGAAIGGGAGTNGSGGTVAISGGTVAAKSYNASGIGGGQNASDNGTVDIIEPMAVIVGEEEGSAGAISNAAYEQSHIAKYVFTETHAPVTYFDWDATKKKLVEKTCTDYAFADRTLWGKDGGWVVVRNNVTSYDRLITQGTVHLILMDGAKLTLNKGLFVSESAALNIYGQAEGTGELLATGQSDYWSAGIGGNSGVSCGAVTINGGKISATGGSFAAGIGGGRKGTGGAVTINGGTVTARGGDGASGIGGGFEAAGGTVTINGGTVDAAGANTAGIGAGMNSDEYGTVTLGENVFVLAGDNPNPKTDVTTSFESTHDQKYVFTAKSDLLDHVEYRVWDPERVSFLNSVCVDYTTITSETTKLTPDKWYVVDGNVTINERIEARGAINLILKDGSTLTASKGIAVDYGYSLNVYGQKNGTGKLIATGTSGAAGIGLDAGASTCGAVTIHGGEVVATGGQGAAGIGGGKGGSGGDITIYGGTVKATGTQAVGIGAGQGDGIHNALALGKGVFLYGGESANPEGDLNNYVGKKNNDYTRNTYMVVNDTIPQHTHHYTYAAGEGDGANVLMATCLDEDCPDSYGDDHYSVSLTINAPTALGRAATLDGVGTFNTTTGNTLSAANIKYYKEEGGEWSELTSAPAATAEGDFRATIGVYEGDDAKAEASIGWHQHDGILFQLWTSTDSLPTSAGSYCLTGDVTLSQGWSAPTGTTNLCLNGQGIRVNKGQLTVEGTNMLNLYDEHTGDAAGTVTTGSNEPGFKVTESGVMNMYGGRIADRPSNSGVALIDDAQFNMYGGEIANCHVGVHLGGNGSPQFVMHDGVITGSKNIGVQPEVGSFVMENGTISNGPIGVFVEAPNAFKLSGTNISPQITSNTIGVKLANQTIGIEPNTTLADTARISVLRTDGRFPEDITGGRFITGLVVPEGVFTSDNKNYGIRVTDDGAEAYLLPVPIEPIENVELTADYTEASIDAIARVDSSVYRARTGTSPSYKWYSCDSNGNKLTETPLASGGMIKFDATDNRKATYTIPTGKAAGTTEYYYCEVTATNTANSQTSVATSNVVRVVVKGDATAATVTANDLTYNGAEQALVTVGTNVVGGKMRYALGDSGGTAPDTSKFGEVVPTATNAGTYYVWSMVAGDAAHYDTDPVCTTVTISPISVTVSGIAAQDKVYDGTTEATLDVSGATFTGKLNADTLTVTAQGAFVDAAAGEGKEVTISDLALAGTSAANYVLADTGQQTTATNTATISPRAITVTADDKATAFGADVAPLSFAVSSEIGLAEGDALESLGIVASTTATKDSPVATYPIELAIPQGAGNPNYDVTLASGTYTITEAALTVSATGYSGAYDGQPHSISVSVEPKEAGAKVYYSTVALTAENYATVGSTEPVTRTDVGTTTVYYLVLATNYQTVAGSKDVAIGKADVTLSAPVAKELAWTGQAQALVEPGSAEGGELLYSLDSKTWSAEVPTAADPGTYAVWYKVVGDATHADVAPASVTATIGPKPTASITKAPVATNPTYTGQAQALVEPGEAEGGELLYSLDGKTWSAEVPTATEPGEYAVWYKVVGDAGHSDSTPQKLTATIAEKPNAAYTVVSGDDSTWVKDDSAAWSQDDKEGLTLTFKRSAEGEADVTFDHFRSVLVDGVELKKDTDYIAKRGSVIVTLMPAFLATLAPGEHTMTTVFDDGSASASFTVAEAAKPEPKPEPVQPEEEGGNVTPVSPSSTSTTSTTTTSTTTTSTTTTTPTSRPVTTSVSSSKTSSLPGTGDASLATSAFALAGAGAAAIGMLCRKRKR